MTTTLCEICKISISSINFAKHLNTKTHIAKAENPSKGKSEKTNYTYDINLSQIAKKLDKSNTNFSWLSDIDLVKLRSFYPNDNTYNNKLTAILAKMKEFNIDNSFIINEKRAMNKTLTTTMKENKILPSMQGKYEDWETIIDIVKQKSNKLTLEEKLIVLLLTMLPPRRNADYAFLKVTNKPIKDALKLDDLFNYIRVTKTGVIKEFIYNNYKTKETYGQQVFSYPKESLSEIKRLLPAEGKVFPNIKDDVEMSNFINNTFEKMGMKIGTQILRKAFITEHLNSKKLTLNEKEELARKMAHSLDMQGKYEVV